MMFFFFFIGIPLLAASVKARADEVASCPANGGSDAATKKACEDICFRPRENPAGALAACDIAVRLNGGKIERSVRSSRGKVYLLLGKYQQALEEFTALKRQLKEESAFFGYSLRAEHGRAYALEHLGRTAEAVTAYERSLGLNYQGQSRRLYDLAYRRRIDALLDKNDVNGALKLFREYEKKTKGAVWGYRMLAEQFQSRGIMLGAAETLAREGLEKIARAGENSEHFEDELEIESWSKAGYRADIWQILGRNFLQRFRPADAANAFAIGASYRLDDGEGMAALGDALGAIGHVEGARRAWRRALTLKLPSTKKLALREALARLPTERSAPSQKPHLGVTIKVVDEAIARESRLPSPQGVIIIKVNPASAAARAGLRVKDIIISADGILIGTTGDLVRSVQNAKASRPYEMNLWRNGRAHRLFLSLDAPTPQLAAHPPANLGRVPYLGLYYGELDPKTAIDRGLAGRRGLIVKHVHFKSPAERSGLRVGDILLTSNGKSLAEMSDLRYLVPSLQIGQALDLTFWRNGVEHHRAIKLGSKPVFPGYGTVDRLFDAIAKKSLNTVKFLVEIGVGVNVINNPGKYGDLDRRIETPLALATRVDAIEIMNLLIAEGADIEAKDEGGWTPLHHAAVYNKKAAAEVLLNAGANPNIPGPEGIYALNLLVGRSDRKDLQQVLIEAGARLDAAQAMKSRETGKLISQNKQILQYDILRRDLIHKGGTLYLDKFLSQSLFVARTWEEAPDRLYLSEEMSRGLDRLWQQSVASLIPGKHMLEYGAILTMGKNRKIKLGRGIKGNIGSVAINAEPIVLRPGIDIVHLGDVHTHPQLQTLDPKDPKFCERSESFSWTDLYNARRAPVKIMICNDIRFVLLPLASEGDSFDQILRTRTLLDFVRGYEDFSSFKTRFGINRHIASVAQDLGLVLYVGRGPVLEKVDRSSLKVGPDAQKYIDAIFNAADQAVLRRMGHDVPLDFKMSEKARAAIRGLQTEKGWSVTGQFTHEQRAQLYAPFMMNVSLGGQTIFIWKNDGRISELNGPVFRLGSGWSGMYTMDHGVQRGMAKIIYRGYYKFYDGQAINFIENGKGRRQLAGGGYMEGNFRNGDPEGRFTFTYPDGKREIRTFAKRQ
jgi:tetratricopeptide (TPR) repeat protein/membrane-associated protease RseP (regulator of RpoE activity)